MTDRELLELAAKAYGMDEKTQMILESGFGGKRWNPLEDDGDALRLAVKLKMCVTSFTDEQMVGYVIGGSGHNIHESPGTDPYAATRRAIVRAASEIGKAME